MQGLQSRQDGAERTSCDGCRWYLGGGCCRINMELECREDEYKLYESKEE